MTNQQTINALHATISNLRLVLENPHNNLGPATYEAINQEITKLAKLANWLDYGEPSDLFG